MGDSRTESDDWKAWTNNSKKIYEDAGPPRGTPHPPVTIFCWCYDVLRLPFPVMDDCWVVYGIVNYHVLPTFMPIDMSKKEKRRAQCQCPMFAETHTVHGCQPGHTW